MAEITCPQCKTANRVSARFCASCGAPLLADLHLAGGAPAVPEPQAEIAADAQLNLVLAGRYRLDRQLGRGGFGAVYEAWDLNLNRRCALKENLDASPDAFRQFGREAIILANLSHPNLPRVTDHFTIPGKGQYLVMDFIDGEDLEYQLKRVQCIPLDRALFWILQVMDALEYLHDQPQAIIHRDVKPANIRVTPQGKAVLVDFGLVKLYDPHSNTTLGARAVTPGFAPPEQYGKGKTDARSDVYALGATLYTILTGVEPLESVQRMLGEPQPAAHRVNPELPPGIGQVIERSMTLDPGQRFQTIAQFRAALQLALAETVEAPETLVFTPPGDLPAGRQAPGLRPLAAAAEPHAHKPGGTRRLTIILAAALALVCLGAAGVVGSLVYNGVQAPARITQTVQMQQTTSARIYATQTAQEAVLRGLTTVGATPPASSPAAAQPTAELPGWPVRFADDFDAATTSFWLGEDAANANFERVSAALQNGVYHVRLDGAKRRNAYWWAKSPQIQTGSEFLLSGRGAIAAGAPGAMLGLIFHLNGQNDSFYLFAITTEQEAGVWLVDPNGITPLRPLEKSAWLQAGQNELSVWGRPGAYRFYINGRLAAELNDAALLDGAGGLYFAAAENSPAAFEVDRIQLSTP